MAGSTTPGSGVADEPKPTKFRSEAVVVEGRRFASKAQAEFYLGYFKLLQGQPGFRDMLIEPRLDLCINDTRVTTFVPDFAWTEWGAKFLCDVKGHIDRASPVWRLFVVKARLAEVLLGVTVLCATKVRSGSFRLESLTSLSSRRTSRSSRRSVSTRTGKANAGPPKRGSPK